MVLLCFTQQNERQQQSSIQREDRASQEVQYSYDGERILREMSHQIIIHHCSIADYLSLLSTETTNEVSLLEIQWKDDTGYLIVSLDSESEILEHDIAWIKKAEYVQRKKDKVIIKADLHDLHAIVDLCRSA